MNIKYSDKINALLPFCLTETHLSMGKRYQGKVRDIYDTGQQLIIICTDRQSAFDRLLAAVPCKGQVLNQCAAWWFEKTRHIVNNHLIALPDPNVSIVRTCRIFRVEFVVRGYITGSTKTSLWTQYQAGKRRYCGLNFPEGLHKNQRLPEPVITATTKEADGDRPLSPEDIINRGLMTAAEWEMVSSKALDLFQYGTELAAQQGFILADSKYEFGLDADNQLVLVDELHTPDSSRFWLAASYESRLAAGLEPDNIDKEFLRLWFVNHCNPYADDPLPAAPAALISELSAKYIQFYEGMTGESFQFPVSEPSPALRIKERLESYFDSTAII